MRYFKMAFMIGLFVFLLASCSKREDTLEVLSESPSDELKAAFAFEGSIYSIGEGYTMNEHILRRIGTINEVVEKINKNGQAKIYDTSISFKPGTEIYEIKDQDKETVISIKISGKYYTAIFVSKLK